jgi:hypothetical protein
MRRLAAGSAEIPVRHPLATHTERGVASGGAVLGHGTSCCNGFDVLALTMKLTIRRIYSLHALYMARHR